MWDDLAAINTVLQHQIEGAAGERLATGLAAVLVDANLALYAEAIELFLEGEDRTKRGVAPMDVVDGLCLYMVDDQLPVINIVSQGW